MPDDPRVMGWEDESIVDKRNKATRYCLRLGCRMPWSRWLINTRNFFLAVLEAGSLSLGRGMVGLQREPSSHCVFVWWKEGNHALGGSFIRALTPSWGHHPMPQLPPKTPTF